MEEIKDNIWQFERLGYFRIYDDYVNKLTDLKSTYI